MHCTGCEQIIEDAVTALPGILSIQVSYIKGSAEIAFDEELVTEQLIQNSIEEKGYNIQTKDTKPKLSIITKIILFIALLLLVGGVAFWGKSLMPSLIPKLNAQMSNFMLFGIGFLTGFHCIGMCGGFIVSYSSRPLSPSAAILSHFAYGAGKTLSYSVIGAACGLLGAMITITPHMRGVAALSASVFLLLYGLKMLNLIPGLRHFTLRLPKAFTRRVNSNIQKQRSPLMIGIFTGFLLGCGPLQAMYIMAAGTGDPQEGATLLFFFGLGTLVPLLSFGFFANLMSQNTLHELVRVSGFLVIIMGIMMANRGLKMMKSGYDFHSIWEQLDITVWIQNMTSLI